MPKRRKGQPASRHSPDKVIEEEDEPVEDVEDDVDEDCAEDEEEEDDDGNSEEGGGGSGRAGSGRGRERPGQRNAANARERARMRVLSRAFCRLKTTLPWVPPDTKLSKLDTLRLAASYIAHLRAMLSAETEAESAAAEAPARSGKGAASQRGAESPEKARLLPVTPNPLHPMNLTWPFSFQRSSSSSSSSSPSSSTSSGSTSSVANGPTVISHLSSEWSSVPDEPAAHYCQGSHLVTMESSSGHQNRMSPPVQSHHLIHHPHHFLPSPYPDSSLLHIA